MNGERQLRAGRIQCVQTQCRSPQDGSQMVAKTGDKLSSFCTSKRISVEQTEQIIGLPLSVHCILRGHRGFLSV